MSYYRHETAIVDDGAVVGDGSRIWHFVHVSAGARIGRDVVLGQNVFVGDGALVGDRCKVQNNVSIYDGVVLEEEVFCGPSMVFTNVVNPRAVVERKDEFRPTRIGRGATLGANSTIVCGTAVGRYALVGAGAVVTRDVKDFALVTGVPARQIGWVSRNGERLQLALDSDGEALCPATGERYVVENGSCRLVE